MESKEQRVTKRPMCESCGHLKAACSCRVTLPACDLCGGSKKVSPSLVVPPDEPCPSCGPTLGGPTPTIRGERERPKPAKGQRWRDTWKASAFDLVTLKERLPAASGRSYRWRIETGDDCDVGYLEEYFTNGRLEFVDHGSTSTTAPMPGAGTATVEQVAAEIANLKMAIEAAQAKAAVPRIALPVPLTARQILTARQRDRDRVRAEAAEAVAALCSEWDLLPDDGPVRR